MLTDETKQSIRDALIRLSAQVPGWSSRVGQRRMIAEVARALSTPLPKGEHVRACVALIEGPTGIGKSLGYLLPGIIVAMHRKLPLVVSTATVALQDQIVQKDLALLAQSAGLTFTSALAKGRGRYACTLKLHQHLGGGNSQAHLPGIEEPVWDRPPEPSELEALVHMAERLASGAWDGDKDSLKDAIPSALWTRITNDSHGCAGEKCPEYKGCPFYRARRQLSGANVIVANHDLVLSTMAAGAPLVEPDKALWCFDEAHHLPAKAQSHLSADVSVRAAIRAMRRAVDKLPLLASASNDAGWGPKTTEDAATVLERMQDILVTTVRSAGPDRIVEPLVRRYRNGQIDDALGVLLENVRSPLRGMLSALETAREALAGEGSSATPLAASAVALLGEMTREAKRVADAVDLLLYVPESERSAPNAKWIDIIPCAEGIDIHLCAAPVDPGAALSRLLWDNVAAAVCTSATLCSLNSFDHFIWRAGLRPPTTSCTALPSPFDHERQGELVIPILETDPGTPELHTAEVARILPCLVANDGTGTVVLFASRKQMEAVYQRLPSRLKDATLVQGELSKSELLVRHRQRVDFGTTSVIFGLESFAEGVDLPGCYCTHVVIPKVPFAVPTSPVDEARAEWVERNGGNAFMQISVPEAALKLTQRAGRLIRTESDTGRLTLLDRRLLPQRYGKSLLDSLPPFRRRLRAAVEAKSGW